MSVAVTVCSVFPSISLFLFLPPLPLSLFSWFVLQFRFENRGRKLHLSCYLLDLIFHIVSASEWLDYLQYFQSLIRAHCEPTQSCHTLKTLCTCLRIRLKCQCWLIFDCQRWWFARLFVEGMPLWSPIIGYPNPDFQSRLFLCLAMRGILLLLLPLPLLSPLLILGYSCLLISCLPRWCRSIRLFSRFRGSCVRSCSRFSITATLSLYFVTLFQFSKDGCIRGCSRSTFGPGA